MSPIAVFSDSEQGHLLSTVHIAKQLTKRGHEVVYLVGGQPGEVIRGFRYFDILSDIPEVEHFSQVSDVPPSAYFAKLIGGQMLDTVMASVRPRAMLVSSLYYLEGLALLARYRVPVIYYLHHLRSTTRHQTAAGYVRTLWDLPQTVVRSFLTLLSWMTDQVCSIPGLVNVMLHIPELVLYPLELDPVPCGPNAHTAWHIGMNVDLERRNLPFDWSPFEQTKPLILCSFGSQWDSLGPRARDYARTLLTVMRSHPEWQMILANTTRRGRSEFEPLPANVRVFTWIPQLQVLSRAAVMITHGGLGSVKEAILSGVPILIVPFVEDEFDVAAQVTRLGLGICARGTTRATEVEEGLSRLLNTEAIHANCKLWEARFLADNECDAAKLIEEICNDYWSLFLPLGRLSKASPMY